MTVCSLIASALRVVVVVSTLVGCGEDNPAEEETFTDTVNWEKLKGTPFEFYLPQDPPPPAIFYAEVFDERICAEHPWLAPCAQWEMGVVVPSPYHTQFLDASVEPLPVFAAYFTDRQEARLAEGLVEANAAAGFEFFRLTDEWVDQALTVYLADDIDTLGLVPACSTVGLTFVAHRRLGGLCFSGVEVVDGVTLLEVGALAENENGRENPTFAHELGHLAGILGHAWAQFGETRAEERVTCLEEGAVMKLPYAPGAPVNYESYANMMAHQGEILRRPLSKRARRSMESGCPAWEEPAYCN